MITPRTSRLLRAPDLRSLHHAIATSTVAEDPLAARRQAIIVPTRAAAESLRRTLEMLKLERHPGAGFVIPEILTRSELYLRFHDSLAGVPPLLSEFDREILFRRAARIASENGAPAPFSLRPGLVMEILGFYDELRRRDKSVADFDRLMTGSLEPSIDFDRGAERMMRQTRFLTAAFTEFERRVALSGGIDEHQLRHVLIEGDSPSPFRQIVVTVADQAADPLGLWTADFDLLARLPGLERLDVIATENVLASGFHQRLHDLLPGIEEEKHPHASSTPVLLVPAGTAERPAVHWFMARDREEELVDAARRVSARATTGRAAVVFQRPLPYLYLARNVFADAQLPYEAHDSLPLAAEPFAAALDLVFTAVTAEGTRSALVELLGSPHWKFSPSADTAPPAALEIAALDAWLQQSKYLGGWGRLRTLAAAEGVEPGARLRARAAPALTVALRLADRLQSLSEPQPASTQIERLLAFVAEFESLPQASDPWHSHHMRARTAILNALRSLADAHRLHDDEPMEIDELFLTIRRWIEGQTFTPKTGAGGVALLDARAAAYASVDDLRIVGLVDSDWPDRGRRSVFYPGPLLSQLGWPAETDRLLAARRSFQDLLFLANVRVSLSTFTLESDAIVSPSVFLEELEAAGLPIERQVEPAPPPPFIHEALMTAARIGGPVGGSTWDWLQLRASRSAMDDDRNRGLVGGREVHAHAVSHLERYLECPFKYFAQYVLSLDEERQDESVLTPQERGQLLHAVFEQFFDAWHAEGNGAITAVNLPAALALFERIADARLAALSETDRSLERTYLLGSAVAPGLAERAFAFEIDHGIGVAERLLEYPLEGEFEFAADGESRRLRIRAKADRIDVLEDDTLRVIDYKLGRAPKPVRALQLPVYGICAAQELSGERRRSLKVSKAGYVAFREKNAFVALGGQGPIEPALEDGQRRLLATVAAIERGEFPVDPDEPFFCARCGYAPVCRKDYVGDE